MNSRSGRRIRSPSSQLSKCHFALQSRFLIHHPQIIIWHQIATMDQPAASPPSGGRRSRKKKWQPANDLLIFDSESEGDEPVADSGTDEAGTTAAPPQPMRSIGMNSSYGAQPARQGPRLQNANKTGLGGTANQWGGFGMPSGGGFGGLGGTPGLGQARPGQLSGFAQVMGGGSGQGPIDMR
jgi:hypothetical protein